ncbi:MAG: transglutaminase family protein [Vicinamibacterales bacterium]
MPAHYAIRHLTRFIYETPVRESVMELRMRPSNTDRQRCLQFEVDIQPRARVFAYRDYRGNWVHHFDLPRRHGQLAITARAQVQIDDELALPERLAPESWRLVDEWDGREEEWEYRQPSQFAVWSPALLEFAGAIGARRDDRDPLTAVRETMRAIHSAFEYAPNSTRVDSPIDESLASRRGVCQDFTHIMLAVLRRMGLPARYVSGYIAPPEVAHGDEPTTIATHAWVEVRLPELGWGSTPPTTSRPACGTSASPSAATMPTCRPPAARSRGRRPASSRSPWTSRRPSHCPRSIPPCWTSPGGRGADPGRGRARAADAAATAAVAARVTRKARQRPAVSCSSARASLATADCPHIDSDRSTSSCARAGCPAPSAIAAAR